MTLHSAAASRVPASFYLDAADGNLPHVSWVIPSSPVSEHPPAGVKEGMAYVTGLVNAIMQGPDWDTTAIFISWDDWEDSTTMFSPPQVDSIWVWHSSAGLDN